MKIENTNEPVHILDSNTDVKGVIRKIADDVNQEEAFYVCHLDEIVEKHNIWQSELPRVVPHYAVKCNDNTTILEVLTALGTSFDCASKGEILKVISLGVSPDNIIFANPVKQASHIRYAASVGVSTMTFDNESELRKIQQIYPTSKLVIRIRCDAVDSQCPLGMKFGCDPVRDAPRLLEIAKSLKLNVVGVSFHVGSGCREPSVFHRAISFARDIFDCGRDLGYSFDLLDIGGGYPGVRGSSINKIARVVNNAIDTFFPEDSVRIIAEPGRFYVSSAYTLACNIHSIREEVKSDKGVEKQHKMYYINDGVYGSFNCILYDHQVVTPQALNEQPGTKLYSSSIWGPTCDGLDQVIEDMLLPEMKMGDWMIFEDMGAYTLPVASSFNGFPIPKIRFAASEGVWTLLKNALSFSDENLDGPVLNIMDSFNNRRFSDIPSTIRLPYYSHKVPAGQHLLNCINVSLIP